MGKVVVEIRKTGQYVPKKTDAEIKNRTLELDMDLVKFTTNLFPDDARMMCFVKEKLASMMSTKLMLEDSNKEEWKTVSEIMETQYKTAVVLKNRIKMGRHVAQKYRAKYGDIKTTQKIVNGHCCNVKIYESAFFEEIELWIAEKMN